MYVYNSKVCICILCVHIHTFRHTSVCMNEYIGMYECHVDKIKTDIYKIRQQLQYMCMCAGMYVIYRKIGR